MLFEGLKFAQRLGEHFRDYPAFSITFAPLLANPEIKELRSKVLNRLRNQAVYHHDDNVMVDGLKNVRMPEYVIARGEGDKFLDVDYTLADILLSKFALPTIESESSFIEQLAPLMRQVLMVGQRFAVAADTLIIEVFEAWGLSPEYDDEIRP